MGEVITEKIYEITIAKEEYDNLKYSSFMLEEINKDLLSLIDNAKISYYRDRLIVDDESIEKFLKRYFKTKYEVKFRELKEKEENE